MIYVSGSECIGRCGQLPLKGSASSDLHQFVRIVVIKSLNSNCVLVLMFHFVSLSAAVFVLHPSCMDPRSQISDPRCPDREGKESSCDPIVRELKS